MRVSHGRFHTVLLFSAVAVFLAGSDIAQAHEGVCASAEIDRPFVLPDGTEHPSGTLRLCLNRSYNPVSSLHATFVDRMPVGMFVSDRRIVEGPAADGYFMVFNHVRRGTLRLAGFVAVEGDRSETFVMQQKAVVTVEDSVPTIAERASSVLLVPATAH